MHRKFAGLCAYSICRMWAGARESSLSVQQRQPLIARHHLTLQRSERGFPWHLSPRSFILLPLFGTMLAQPFRAKVYHSHTTKLHLTPQTQAKVTHTLGLRVSPTILCRHIWHLFCGYFGTSALSYLFADVPCSSTHSLYLITASCMCVCVREELPSCHFMYLQWHENKLWTGLLRQVWAAFQLFWA